MAARPLFVDLDGTLIIGDSLWESIAALIRNNPLILFLAVLKLIRHGRAAFKQEISAAFIPSIDNLLIDKTLKAYLTKQANSRPIILATAANRKIADSVATSLGIFSDVIASDANRNLKGNHKLESIRTYLDERGLQKDFAYIGDSKADRPIWAAAGRAMVVAPNETNAEKLAGEVPLEELFIRPAGKPSAFIKAMRIHQWVKNVLIFVPLILAHAFFQPEPLIATIATFLGFSLCASATYIWNDLLDIHADRQHSRKHTRPLASGAISIPEGLAFSFLLLSISAVIISLFAAPEVLLLFGGYILITVSYSVVLKTRLLVDVITLGVLYGYRIFIGGVASGQQVSDWLIVFSIFFFLGLALVKRFIEIVGKSEVTEGRIGSRGYYTGDATIVAMIGVVASITSVLVMALYISSPEIMQLYEHPKVLWVVCLVLIYWVGRVWVLAYRNHMYDDPIVFALRDKISIACGGICALALIGAL